MHIYLITTHHSTERSLTTSLGGGQEARSRKLAELERLFNAIRSEPIDVVDDLVGSIRADRQIRRLQAGGQHAGANLKLCLSVISPLMCV